MNTIYAIFCSTSGSRRVNLVINPVISNECGKDREVEHICGRKTFEVMTST